MTQPNLKAEIILKWGDGEYLFALKGKQIEHLEKACDAGIGDIAHRVMSLRPRYGDIKNILWLGLEGGGMPPVVVKEKMDRFFDGQPLAALGDPSSPLATAAAVIQAAYFGVGDIPKGEAPAGESPAKSTSVTTEPPSSKAV
jgi:hypothetical protein